MADPWAINTLVFDLDDTLYPERDYVFSGFRAVGEWMSDRHGVSGFGTRAQARFAGGERGRVFDSTLADFGMEASPALIGELVEVYRNHQPRINLFPDAFVALEWASGRFNVALITDGYASVQEKKITALGLERWIPCRIITDALGRHNWKPSPAAYRAVMDFFSGPAGGFVYIGDNPRKDFIGARRLGWRTIRIIRPEGEHANYQPAAHEAAEIEITSLDDLDRLLAEKCNASVSLKEAAKGCRSEGAKTQRVTPLDSSRV